MKNLITKLIAAALILFVFPLYSHGYGELTFMPSYFATSDKIVLRRFGLYIQEELNEKWFYSSWTGTGEVFITNPNSQNVVWYTTQQDANYVIDENFIFGVGAGFGYSLPGGNKEWDMHFKFAAKLWK